MKVACGLKIVNPYGVRCANTAVKQTRPKAPVPVKIPAVKGVASRVRRLPMHGRVHISHIIGESGPNAKFMGLARQ